MKTEKKKPLRRLIVGVLAAAGIAALILWDIRPRVIDTSVNGEYTAELLALDGPDWPFGTQDGRLVLKKGIWTVCAHDFILANDGKYMCEYNWSVAWDDEKAVVTISGEEQHDEVYHLYYTGAAICVKSHWDHYKAEEVSSEC